MHLPEFNQVSVAVIGDAMLDRYLSGTAHRISPEAPVPVVLQKKMNETAGGAANVAANITALGAFASLISLVGPDEEADRLGKILDGNKIEYFFFDFLQHTVLKTRILANGQQLVRIDRESPLDSIEGEKLNIIYTEMEKVISRSSVVVLSDYAKGMLLGPTAERAIKFGRQYRKPVIVDPKCSDWSKYSGADVITPNLKELSEAVGKPIPNRDEEVKAAALTLLGRYDIKAIVITRSEKGMTYVSAEETVHAPTGRQEVYDVTGAGDTALAMIALLMNCEMTWTDRLRWANVAAGIAVSSPGTVIVSREKVTRAISAHETEGPVEDETLRSLIRQYRNQGKRIVFTNGCFDVLHRGHVTLLEQAARLGDVLIVGLNTDDSVKRLKGPSRPINTLNDRAFVLSRLSAVNVTTSFDEDTPARLIELIKPDFLVKGGDYKPEEVVGREHAGQTVIIPLVKGHSSTQTIVKSGKA